MLRFIYVSFVVITLTSMIKANEKLEFHCYLNKGTKEEIKIGFSHFNFFTSDSIYPHYELGIKRVEPIYHKQTNQSGQVSHALTKLVTFYGSGLNILHFMVGQEKKKYSDANYLLNKMCAFNFKVPLNDPNQIMNNTSDVTAEMIVNKNLYVDGQLPYFNFTIDKVDYKMECELQIYRAPVIRLENTAQLQPVMEPELHKQNVIVDKNSQNFLV